MKRFGLERREDPPGRVQGHGWDEEGGGGVGQAVGGAGAEEEDVVVTRLEGCRRGGG